MIVNESARIILASKWSYMINWMTFKVIFHFMKHLCLYNVDILESFKKIKR